MTATARTSETGMTVIAPGASTTVQDGGRPGFQAKGITPSGAQDWLSYALGCVLVGNEPPPAPLTHGYPGDAALEATLTGPTLVFHEASVIALTGAPTKATLDDQPVAMWTALPVTAGSTLRCGRIGPPGLRSYVSVAGGLDVPPYLGSRATYARGSQGGIEGRPLRSGDAIPIGRPRRQLSELARRTIREELRPAESTMPRLRVVPGPQEHLFTDQAVDLFYGSEWQLSPTSDRMGFRFIGPMLQLKPRPDYLLRDAGSGPADIVDDVIPIGGIQYAGGTEPIVLGVEGPSVGGYAKIGTLISADWRVVGQLRPGQTVCFERLDSEAAVAAGRAQAVAARESALSEGD